MRNVKFFRNIAVFILSFAIFAATAVSAGAFTPPAKTNSEGVFLINLDTDITIYEKNPTERYYPASTTKIMTCLVVLEKIKNLNENVKVTYDATNEFWEGDPNKEGPSNAEIQVGQTNLTYRDCLYALMVSSACEAANILAYNVGGGEIANFVKMMNDMAVTVGCVDTHFGNAHGLFQKDNYTTPYDMFRITKYAYDTYPEFMEICGATEYQMPANSIYPDGYTIYTTNKMMVNSASNPYYYEYAKGVKTGSIDYFIDLDTGEKTEGCCCLVSTAEYDGYHYLLVTLGAPYFDSDGNPWRTSAFEDHIALYKWVFGTFTYQTILSKSEIEAEVKVEQGEDADYVQLKPIADYSTLLPKDLDASTIQHIVNTEKSIVAPVTKGQVMGSVELRKDGETLVIVDLVAAESVSRSQVAYITEQAKEIADTVWFKALLVVLALLVCAVVVLIYVSKAKKAKAAKKNARRKRSNYH